MSTDLEVLIVGTGFGGLCAAIELRREGMDNFAMLERRSFMGGTWMQNRYPGAAVDVHSPLYSLSREPYDWSQMLASRQELETYTTSIIARHGLAQKAKLNTTVTHATWLAKDAMWEIHTEEGPRYRARFVINATGPLSAPSIPKFPGFASFTGPQFHTNMWDQGVDLTGKRVAVIGSGASAAQVIPAITPNVAQLHVFQRSPHWVLPRPDHQFSPWQRALLRKKLPYKLLRWAIYWGLETRVVGFKYSDAMLKIRAQDKALAHLHAQVKDEALRSLLTPSYTIGCKRVLLSNTLYPALTQKHVTLHPKDDAIKEITPGGITTRQGNCVELDTIVYATGFDAKKSIVSYEVTGDQGTTLEEVWDPYPRAYLGTSIPNFPNFFILTGPNSGIGHTSAIFVIESQMRYILRCIKEAKKMPQGAISPKPAAENHYTDNIHHVMKRTVWHTGGCQSWYQGLDGRVIAIFPGFSFTYWALTGWFRHRHHQLHTS